MNTVKLGDQVFFADDKATPLVALVAHVHEPATDGRVNLAVFRRDGQHSAQLNVPFAAELTPGSWTYRPEAREDA